MMGWADSTMKRCKMYTYLDWEEKLHQIGLTISVWHGHSRSLHINHSSWYGVCTDYIFIYLRGEFWCGSVIDGILGGKNVHGENLFITLGIKFYEEKCSSFSYYGELVFVCFVECKVENRKIYYYNVLVTG